MRSVPPHCEPMASGANTGELIRPCLSCIAREALVEAGKAIESAAETPKTQMNSTLAN
jgi:hypothetical protein